MALFLVFTFLIIFLWYSETTNDAEKSAVESVSEILKNSNENFEVALKDINGIVFSAALNDNVIKVLSTTRYSSNIELLNDNLKVEEYMSNLYTFKYYINGMIISDIYGREFKNDPVLGFNDIKTKTWYKDILDSKGKQIFIPPHYYNKTVEKEVNDNNIANGNIYNNQVLSIARPIFLENRVIGFVMVDIKGRILRDIYSMKLKRDAIVLLIDNKNHSVIFNSGLEELSIPSSDPAFNDISKKILSKTGSFYEKINGSSYLVIYYHSDYTNWTSVGLIPRDNLLMGFNKMRKTILIISITFCLMGIIISYFISHLLTKRIYKLNIAMNNLDDVNFKTLSGVKSNDEIGMLYRQFNSMVLRIDNLVQDIRINEREKRRAEVKILQAQINPHFLYNTLNTIKFLAIMQHVDNIRDVSEALTVLLHVNMDKRVFISIREEVEYIKCYFNIQEYKYSNKFKYELHIEEDVYQLNVLKLILQPIVENSLKHGIQPSSRQGVIVIKIYKEVDFLKMKVQDNGVGMDEKLISNILDNKVQSESIGITNVISRIKLNFGDNYGMQIYSQKHLFTTVEITLPIISDEEMDQYV